MTRKINDFSWKVAGSAGDGILSAGMLFAKTCMKGGLNIVAMSEYPSLIRGGHNHLDVRVGEKEIFSHSGKFDMLIALNQESVDYHASKINQGGGIIFDSEDTKPDGVRQDILLFDVPLKKIANENGGLIMRNTIAMGATLGLLDFDLGLFNKVLAERFGKKEQNVIDSNVRAAYAGYDYVKKHYDGRFSCKLEKRENAGKILMTGNEAISAGMIKAGCKFYSAYPMTPASSILSNLAAYEKDYGMVVKHTEDEIAAINMAIGAGFAGARSATGTSGGGFALMVEALGLAAMTEVPLVVIEAQRPGPATGMATHTGQGDLRFLMHAGTDEFPKVIVAPGDVDECFFETIKAFNIAEKYQIPVIILTDKYLGESYFSTEEFDTSAIEIDRGLLLKEGDLDREEHYKRYKITESGISPRSRPGIKGGMHVASSYEHDEKGFEREEEPIRVAMHDKRFRKLDNIQNDFEFVKIEGDSNPQVTVVSWGSTKGQIREATRSLRDKGIRVNFVQILYLCPFPANKIREMLAGSKIIVDIENNRSGQLAGLIREHTGIEVTHKILKYDGRAFSPEDLVKALGEIAGGKSGGTIIVKDYDEDDERNLDRVKMRTFKVIEAGNK